MRLATFLALGLSILLNVYLVWARPKADPAPAKPPEDGAPPDCPETGLKSMARAVRRPSFERLEARAKTTTSPTGAKKSLGESQAASDTAQRGLVSPSTIEVQQDALCQIAKEHLHDHWQKSQPALTRLLRDELSNPDIQRQRAESDATEIGAILGLDAARTEALAQTYLAERGRLLSRAAKAVNAEPPDYRALLGVAKTLYATEDEIVRRMFGPVALAKLRATHLEKRTAVLAIVATYAQVPWDQKIGW